MTKTYTFYDDSYYSSYGCSCCEQDYMECWNSEDIHHSCMDKEDAYRSALVDYIEKCDELDYVALANYLKIKVEFKDESSS